MFKCIAYDENNKRKVVKLDLHSEEEVFHYASKNNLKIVDVKKRRKLFCRKKLLLVSLTLGDWFATPDKPDQGNRSLI